MAISPKPAKALHLNSKGTKQLPLLLLITLTITVNKSIKTERGLVVAQGWGQRCGGWGVTPDRYELFFSGWGRHYGIRQWSWLHNLVNIPKTTKLFLLNGWIWWYVHYLKANTQANDYQVPFLAKHLHPSSYQDLTKQIFFPFSSSGNGGIDLRQHPASKPGWGVNTDLSRRSHCMQQAMLPTLQSINITNATLGSGMVTASLWSSQEQWKTNWNASGWS